MRKRLSLHEKAFIALKEAVREVIEHHRQTGRPLAVWQDGRVRKISAKSVLAKSRS